MTESEQIDLRRWLESRFDRVDRKVDHVNRELGDEIKATRHGFRPVLEQMAVQMAELVTVSRQHDRELAAIDAWRADEGPLDTRLKRHASRHNETDRWRNRMVGGMAVITFLFPVTIGVVVALLR